MEGWKAVLSVVLRSGLGRRQRVRSVGTIGTQPVRASEIGQSSADNEAGNANDAESGIQAMVDGVKVNGVSKFVAKFSNNSLTVL